ncbi:MAG: hypothetical protein ACTTIL_05585 [Bacteroidia bacterium]|uniref:hypothetical protein n=1 Tax=Porphyromonas gingivalis TaxID=837 RepID=UPI000BE75FD9|nr:hypothetical protein [Porphyromonas gingivalis]PDP64106.1 hypothetical protein CLI80_06520 [Porphyromonas gingivalis]
MIQRFFHPVGQGAFYSERHICHNINIVYDCGTTNPSSPAKQRIVGQSFNKEEVINILFISHFDKDHISLIDTLKNTVQKIERVVMPLLHYEEKIFLSNIYKSLGQSRLATLVSKPSEFFGRETQIITVRPGSEERIVEREPVNVSEIDETTQKISSGTPLTINGLYDWVYIPFNHEYKDRNEEFLRKLHEKGIDVSRLKGDPEYALDPMVKKKIKTIYRGISGGINQNSMFLYSGPLKYGIHYRRGRYWRCQRFYRSWFLLCKYFGPEYFDPEYFDPERVACLYTGDGDLNKVNVRTIYGQYWGLIGTIQIPHHGSLPSFNANVLDDEHFLCPISVGKNSYGHPSQKVISDILSHISYPILVTEDVGSAFVEIIRVK